MSKKLMSMSATAMLMGGTALAEVPAVSVDIAPVHSLVARVMDGAGAPSLIVPPEATPHEYSLRPSEAAALQAADLVFWMGEDLTPWMEDAIATLAVNATVTNFLEVDGTKLLDIREDALFEAHDEDADDHENEGSMAEDHDHGDHDPHAWLSVENASTWLNVIAAQLSAADPGNAEVYSANAAAARAEMDALAVEVNATLEPVREGSFVVFHDAYQYFESDFEFPAAGAISLGDASDPSPARIAEVQARIRDEGINCVLSEPQFNPGLVATVLDGATAGSGVIDPLGADLKPGATLYPQLIRNMAKTLAECL